MCYDTWNGQPGGGINRRVGGVFSVPQDWSDAEAFGADIRLHVGSWESAQPTLYKTPPKPNSDVRKLAGSAPTETGLFITTAAAKYEGGPWRLDLDEKGHNKFFGVVKSIDATGGRRRHAAGSHQAADEKGLSAGSGTRSGNYGRTQSDQVHSLWRDHDPPLFDSADRLREGGVEVQARRRQTRLSGLRGGAPGTLTVRYDLVRKIKSTPEAQGPLAASLSGGPSAGPAFLLTPIPGEAAQGLGRLRLHGLHAVHARFLQAPAGEVG